MPNTNKPDNNAEIILSSLKQSVNNALDRKRRLGQYAVIEVNGEIIELFNDNKNDIAASKLKKLNGVQNTW